nr:hypothetical protein [Nocardiopsis terrae]
MRCVLTTETHPWRTVALCGAVLLLATACGEGHGHSPRQLSEMIAETVRESADSGLPGLGMPDTLFDPARYACTPAVDPELPGGWRSVAPRAAAGGGEPVELGLTDSEAEHSDPVLASVTGPDGETASAEADLTGDAWARLDYPEDFGAGETVPGVYTVVWSDSRSGAPLTCDGFEVE